jgi:hypothetical protein
MGEWLLSAEGQVDRSQARSAWVAIQRAPVPEGRSKSLSIPEIFVVETEFMPLSKRRVFLLKGMLASNLSRDRFNRPAGTRLFSS